MNTPPQVPIRTSPLAIWSLVLGILGIVCIGPLAAIPAVICGHMAMSRVKASNGSLQGNGQALAGLIMGYVGIALMVIYVPMMAAIAIPNFIKARDTSMLHACRNNLRQIEGAKEQWALANNLTEDLTPKPGDLAPTYMEQMPVCPKGGVYTIGPVSKYPTCSIEGHALDTE